MPSAETLPRSRVWNVQVALGIKPLKTSSAVWSQTPQAASCGLPAVHVQGSDVPTCRGFAWHRTPRSPVLT